MIKKKQHIYLHNDSQACRRTKEWSAAAQRLAPWLQQTRVTKSQSHDLLTSYLDKNRDGSPYRMMLQSQKHRLRVLVFSRVSGKCHQEAGAHTHSNTQTHTHTQTHFISAEPIQTSGFEENKSSAPSYRSKAKRNRNIHLRHYDVCFGRTNTQMN